MRGIISLAVLFLVLMGAVFLWPDSADRQAGETAALPAAEGSQIQQSKKTEAPAPVELQVSAEEIANNPLIVRKVEDSNLAIDLQADIWAPNPVHNLKTYFTE